MKSANDFVDLLRELIREEEQKRDTTVMCEIESVDPDGYVNIYLLPDQDTIIPHILNASKYTFQKGDIGILFKIQNQLNNCFVIAKVNPHLNDEKENVL